jgi:universal stress protein A
MKWLLVPTDFSERSRVTVTHAISLARQLGASIELLHVFETPVNPAPEVAARTPLPPDKRAEIDQQLEPEAALIRDAGVPCETLVVWGEPGRVIVQRASERPADFIVIGSKGRTGLAHVLLGSVTESVLRKVRCPVVVVPAAALQAGA